MPTINQLTAVDTVTGSDQVPIYSAEAGDARKAALFVIAAYIQEAIAVSISFMTQYAAPSATGFSVQINNDSDNVWLVLTPLAGYANGTLVMPELTNCIDQQEVLVNCTQSVAALAITGNGATVTGAPTALTANGFFRLKFEAVMDTWYRVG